MDTIVRPAGPGQPRPWLLQRREWDGGRQLTYRTLAQLTEDSAREAVASGEAYWYFGEPERRATRVIQRELELAD